MKARFGLVFHMEGGVSKADFCRERFATLAAVAVREELLTSHGELGDLVRRVEVVDETTGESVVRLLDPDWADE